jgi:hypothetical protein
MSPPRLLASLSSSSLSLAASAGALVLLLAGTAQAGHKGHRPPKFAGLKSAVTCTPGPVGPGRTGSYHLSWEPASDEVTPPGKIAYEIYQATSAGGENFAHPTYRSARGATSFSTPPLASDRSFYFVVRARDKAGNEDANKVERLGENLCV